MEIDIEMAADAAQKIIDLEAKLERMLRINADQLYMQSAMLNMLGPKAIEVVQMWARDGVNRVHYSWGPKTKHLSGEERAQVILDVSNAPTTEISKEEME